MAYEHGDLTIHEFMDGSESVADAQEVARQEGQNFVKLWDRDDNLQTAIANEAARAAGAETNLQTQITTETNRATYAETNLQSQIDAEVTARMGGDASLQGQINAANVRMDSIENLGHYVGSFATKAALPPNVSAFGFAVTVSDFATVRADETNDGVPVRYVVSAIDANTGAITWAFDVAYSVDISGKADISDLNAHINDAVKHVTAAERTAWNGKANDWQSITGISENTSKLPEDSQSVNTWILRFCNRVNGLISALAGKADKANVTATTATKITYNSQGIVTAGAVLAASDIPALDASKITSGTFADARIASASVWNGKINNSFVTIASSALPSAWPNGFSMGAVYNNGYPATYGTVFSSKGGNGNACAQILVEWSGTNGGLGNMWFRNARDQYDGFSAWTKVAKDTDVTALGSKGADRTLNVSNGSGGWTATGWTIDGNGHITKTRNDNATTIKLMDEGISFTEGAGMFINLNRYGIHVNTPGIGYSNLTSVDVEAGGHSLINKQDKLNRTVGGNDNATGTVTDTGGNLSVPMPVTVTAPAASDTQTTAGTFSLRAVIKTLVNNIAHLFIYKMNNKAVLSGASNLNSYTTGGFYSVANPAANRPTGVSSNEKVFLWVWEDSTDGNMSVIYQECLKHDTVPVKWMRSRVSNVWSEWQKLTP